MFDVFIKVSGYTSATDDKWINTEQIVEIHYNEQEKRYDIAMASQRYIEVLEPEAMAAIDRLVSRDIPQTAPATDETYI
jgi:hypothetical protein